MSLFSSAFHSSPVAGPSTQLNHHYTTSAKPDKRKRPSIEKGPGEKDDQLRATQANLERLMSKVEKGDVKPKREGAEATGVSAEARKGKRNKRVGFKEDAIQEGKKAKGILALPNTEPRRTNMGLTKAGMGDGLVPQDEKKAWREVRANEKAQRKAKAKEIGIEVAVTSNPAPARLPPKRLIPASPRPENGAEEESLTEMQKGMKAKLEAARFRWINEQLYSTPSTEAVAMMKKDPKVFAHYHMTHRVLTSAWPSPPLPYLISLLTPLPAKTVIADLGCGEAGLARALVPQGKVVLSYDLVGDSGVPGFVGSGGWVIEADFLQGVPLPGRAGGSSEAKNGHKGDERRKIKKKDKGIKEDAASEVVDVVVCCLSLMGTNWVGGIYEACRILKQGGTLHIAEVTSRFISTDFFTTKVESFGFKLEKQESPSSHFTLFRLLKASAIPLGPARNETGFAERVAEGEEILRGCVYKKR